MTTLLAPTVLALGPILCDLCHTPFTPPANTAGNKADEQPEPDAE